MPTYENLYNQLIVRAENDEVALKDAFSLLREIEKTNYEFAHSRSVDIRKYSSLLAKKTGSLAMIDLNKKALLFDAKNSADCYLRALEYNRPMNEQFYMPRRKVLKPFVDSMQDLVDDKLDELFLNCPPRVGKTSLLMFFVTWILGKYPEKSNLYSAFSDIITSAFYNGVLEVINDPTTYCWHEIFPESKIVRTNSKDETIDIDRAKRYPTLTCRSLYGTLNGAVDCNGFLISDDLIGGIEEALNKDRMVSAWSKVDNNMIPRAKQGAKLLWCGTRWSIIDPAGLRIDLLQHDQQFANRRFKVLRIPALDEHDESNFNYLYNVGFSTEFYKQRRASFERNNDMASWLAQYQNEPIERQGALFEPQDMNFYNGVLPDEEHLVRVFMAVDPAYGGGDFTAAPVCYQYEDGRIYVHDVVFSDGDKNVTQPLIVSAVQRNNVNAIQFEANKSTLGYKENVEDMLKKQGLKVHITTKVAPNNKSKEQRIYDKAPEIREMYFLEEGKRSKEYEMFMQNVYSFTITGRKVKHDDAPDALAQAVDMVVFQHNKIEVFRKTW